MSEQQIKPERITRPIQLLAAWLTGLVVINGGFLFSASYLSSPSWGSAVLVIAAVINVPLFLVAMFVLQTRFRPEMQEDAYYSKYLDSKHKHVEEMAKKLQEDIGA